MFKLNTLALQQVQHGLKLNRKEEGNAGDKANDRIVVC